MKGLVCVRRPGLHDPLGLRGCHVGAACLPAFFILCIMPFFILRIVHIRLSFLVLTSPQNLHAKPTLMAHPTAPIQGSACS